MKPYEKYKDSGVPWIGEIPEGWEVRKLKYFAKIKNGQDYKKVVVDSGYPVIGSGGQFAFANEFLWDKPSVLLGRKGTVDKPLYIDVPFWTVDTMYYTDINKKSSAKYLYYLATTIHFSYYQYGSAVPSMTQEDLNNIFFATPEDILSQQKIADYLDSKTTSIDSLIADKQKLIELLKEKRQAIISETVTKGLDKTVPMKDSGVPWIGEIPEGWEVSKIGLYYETQLGKMLQPKMKNDIDTLETYLSAVNIKDSCISLEPKKEMWFSYNDKNTYDIQSNDLLVVEGGDVGLSCIYNFNHTSYMQNAIHRVRPNNGANNFFLCYWMKFLKGIGYMDLVCNKATIAHYTKDKLLNTPYLIIPIETQQKIADYLDTQTANIDTTITDLTTQIEKLKEYRQAIISEVVTGKVMV